MRVYDAAGNLKTIDVLAAHNLLSASHGDTLTAGVVRGDIVVGNASPAWSRLPTAGAATVLHGGTDPSYGAVVTADITNSNVTYAKIQNVVANSKLLGSGDAGAGAAPVEITLGANLTMTGTTLAATGGGGGDVTGPGSSVDNEICRFDLATGKLIQAYTSLGPTIGDDGEADFRSEFVLTGSITATVAADTDDWAPTGLSTASSVRVTVTGTDHTLGGMTGGTNGRIFIITNISAVFRLILNDEDIGSTATNRFLTGAGDIRLESDESAVLQFDPDALRWRVIAVNRGLVDLGQDIKSVLADGSGGTGFSTYAQGDMLYASATDVLSKLGAGTAFQHLRMNSAGTIMEWAVETKSKSITIEDPVSSEIIPMWLNEAAITVLGVSFDCTGGTSVGFSLEQQTSIASGTVIHADTASADSAEWDVTPSGTAAVPTNRVILLELGTVTGGVTELIITVHYRENQ